MWLLAGLIWLGGALLCRSFASPVLRFVVDPVEYPVMWLSEDGRRILHYQNGNETPIWFGVTHQPDAGCVYRAFDFANGAVIATHDPAGDEVALIPEQGLLIVREGPGGISPYSLVDLIGGTRTSLTWPGIDESEPMAARATADGRFVVVVSHRLGGYETVWWDRAIRSARVFSGLEPVALAANGRWLTQGDTTDEYCVREPNNDAIVCRVVSSGGPICWVEFDHSGERVFFCRKSTIVGYDGEVYETHRGGQIAGASGAMACFGKTTSNRFIALNASDASMVVELRDMRSNECIRKRSIRDYGPSCRHKEIWTSAFDRYLMVNWGVGSSSAFGRFIAQLPVIGDYYHGDEIDYYAVVDSQTAEVVSHFCLPYSHEKRLSPDGKSLLIRNASDDRWSVWDVPPRKSAEWMSWALGWGGLVALLAVWRVWRFTHPLPRVGFDG